MPIIAHRLSHFADLSAITPNCSVSRTVPSLRARRVVMDLDHQAVLSRRGATACYPQNGISRGMARVDNNGQM